MLWNQAHAPPLLVKSFPKKPRARPEASRFGGSHKYKTKQTKLPCFIDRSVACAIGPNVNPLQNSETQHVNIVLQCMRQFFEQPNMKGNRD